MPMKPTLSMRSRRPRSAASSSTTGPRFNWETLGLSTVYAVVEVTVEPQENVGYNAVARRIARFDEVRTV